MVRKRYHFLQNIFTVTENHSVDFRIYRIGMRNSIKTVILLCVFYMRDDNVL